MMYDEKTLMDAVDAFMDRDPARFGPGPARRSVAVAAGGKVTPLVHHPAPLPSEAPRRSSGEVLFVDPSLPNI